MVRHGQAHTQGSPAQNCVWESQASHDWRGEQEEEESDIQIQFRGSCWWFEGCPQENIPWVYCTFVDVCAAVFAAACLILSFKTFQVWWIRTLYFSPELAVILSFALGCCAANLRLPTAGIAMQSFKVISFGTSGPQDYMTRLNPCFWLQPTYFGDTWLQGCETFGLILIWVQHMWSYNHASHPEPYRFEQCRNPCSRAMGSNLIAAAHLLRFAQVRASVSLLWTDLWVMSVLHHQNRLQIHTPWKRKWWHPKGQHLRGCRQQLVSMSFGLSCSCLVI